MGVASGVMPGVALAVGSLMMFPVMLDPPTRKSDCSGNPGLQTPALSGLEVAIKFPLTWPILDVSTVKF